MNTCEKFRLKGTPHFETILTENCLDEVMRKTIPFTKPNWDIETLNKLVFSNGTSNKIFGFRSINDQPTDDVLLFRIYGEKTELLLDRALELENFSLLSDNGLAPKLFCTFKNGFCYAYQPGSPITSTHLQKDKFLRETGLLVSKLHSIQPSCRYVEKNGMKAKVFVDLKRYCALLKDDFQLEVCPRYENENLYFLHVLITYKSIQIYLPARDGNRAQ